MSQATTEENNELRSFHMNKAQLKVNIVSARETWCVWARGTGKGEGVLAPAQLRNVMTMPRSLGINCGATFSQILMRTLPGIVKAWEKLGYQRDKHFFIGQYAPKQWGWQKPYFAPIDGRYIIHWYTGAAIMLISQDGVGMANGISSDYIHGDEAKFLNYEKLKSELYPINRGNNQYFGHLPQHHSMLFTTDRPTSSKAQWILEKQKLHDEKLVNLIIEIQAKVNEITEKFPTYTDHTFNLQRAYVRRLEKQLALLRMKCVMYSEASALDNIHVLGLDFIKQMKRNLPKFEFDTSILNLKVRELSNNFYPLFDESTHTYERYNESYFDTTGYDFDKLATDDCRKDGDCISNEPLDLAIDYGASINIAAVGQERSDNREDVIKEFYVKQPMVLDDLLKEFVRYYKFHRNKTVHYYFDHTAIAHFAHTSKTYRDIVVEYLSAHGWEVVTHYTGQAPEHEDKYNFWNDVLAERSTDKPIFRMNRAQCPSLKKSMEDAPVKQTEDGFKKDKSSERNKAYPQEWATHGSDVVDQLVWGKFKSGWTRRPSEFLPNVTL